MDEEGSYTSASGTFPIKLFHNADVSECLRDGMIPPAHLQLNPTNACNLNCSFCSCSDRQQKDKLDFEELKAVLARMTNIGLQSVTISGGGEPCMYGKINELIEYMYKLRLKISLVSNGLLLDRIKTESLGLLTWARISFDSSRAFDGKFEDSMMDAISRAPQVDWAFSYVAYGVDVSPLRKLVEFANTNKFTHVRVVSDINNPIGGLMEHHREGLVDMDTRIVIFQDRIEYTKGAKNCWISLLKPVIGADGRFYPCCGTQYATEGQARDLVESLSMGHMNDFNWPYHNKGDRFDGSVCDKCYYGHYNEALERMLSDVEHVEFV